MSDYTQPDQAAKGAQIIWQDETTMASLRQLLIEAGDAIMEVYQHKDFGINKKADDSPVTQADLTAHHILLAGLTAITPTIPVVSEEDASTLSIPQSHDSYWLIDPLDGTKEFISRNGQFTVNLALISGSRTCLGFVSTPIDQSVYWGGQGLGAYRIQNGKKAPLQTQATAHPIRVVASKSHLNSATSNYIEALGDTALVQAGSSLKFLRIAEGTADFYPRMAPTCEWDTAAAQAILEGAGGKVTQADGSPMEYGKANILNPHFIASNGYL